MRSQRIIFGSCDQNEAVTPLDTQYQIDTGVPDAIERESNDTEMADAAENTSAKRHKEGEGDEGGGELEESGGKETAENDVEKSEDDDDEDGETEEQNGQVAGDNNQQMAGHGGDDPMVIEDLGVAVKAIDLDGDNDMIDRWKKSRNRNGDDTAESLGDYVREGQYNLQHRICEIGKWAIHSGTTQHARHSQYELWVHKIANSIGQLEAFAENFDLGKILGCDQETSELPLTGGEVLALVYICGKYLGSGVDRELIMGLDILTVSVIFDAVPIPYVDPEIVHFILDTARRCSQRQNGSGFGPWGQVDFQDIDLSGDKVTQFGSADRSLTADQALNSKVKPAELLTMIMVKATHPVPFRIQEHFPDLAVSLMNKGLECSVKKLFKKGNSGYVCLAIVNCAGFGFNCWSAKAKAGSKEAVLRKFSSSSTRKSSLRTLLAI
ncbi:hypothetical protein TWF103_008975 [Orbilia oligospora]|uniref:Uncharacterized protein n=1 Tax=Orbilia oligospora TaxID=2813651 RepID=A0A7C8JPP8_ORBOL|nr:hypothetical protein TWF103_008975 [Orbilia oligospora]KAF3135783.1 hypothetical protein TWF703_005878 [Orbilia oligospora]